MRTGSYARQERDEFLHAAGVAGLPLWKATKIAGKARTLARLAESQCNGDWPADHGDAWPTAECAGCQSMWAPSVLKRRPALNPKLAADLKGSTPSRDLKYCPDCRAAQDIREMLPDGWTADFSGDPRGFVVHLVRKTPTSIERIGVA